MNTMNTPSPTDLTNCDREQIHLVGAIQSHGYFLAFNPVDDTIHHASLNASDLFGIDAKELCGKNLSEIFGEPERVSLKRARAEITPTRGVPVRLHEISKKRGSFDLYLYEFEGLIALEIERHATNKEDDYAELSNARKESQVFLEQLHATGSLESAAKLACRAIRSMIGFDRVMMYRYFANWDGEVIAEDKSPEAHSFFQHRFPATDIPLPARQLYLRNRTRQITDSSDTHIAIWPQTHYLTRRPIDLSSSKLRAVSLIHLEYLRNMNVKASFSVAVIVEGELWGLIACHGRETAVISHEIRLACESVAATFSLVANMREQLGEQGERLTFEDRIRALFSSLIQSPSLVPTLFSRHAELEKMFEATGVALVTDDSVEIAGLAPPESFMKEIAQKFKERFTREHKTLLATDNLATVDESLSQLKEIACGAIATYAPSSNNAVFMIFRPEQIRVITWGGDPRKTLAKRGYEGKINPRASFESWQQTISGHSKPWTSFQLRGAEFIRDFVLDNLVKKERLLDELAKQLKS